MVYTTSNRVRPPRGLPVLLRRSDREMGVGGRLQLTHTPQLFTHTHRAKASSRRAMKELALLQACWTGASDVVLEVRAFFPSSVTPEK